MGPEWVRRLGWHCCHNVESGPGEVASVECLEKIDPAEMLAPTDVHQACAGRHQAKEASVENA